MTRPLPRLKGLADGLAPEERRYDGRADHRFAPRAVGPPLPVSNGNSADARRDRTSAESACTLVLFTSTAGRIGRAHGLCDKFRDVRGVLAGVDVRRHLTIAVRTALEDRVEDELLVRRQLIQVRTDPRDGVGRLERVAEPTTATEELLPVLLLCGETGHLRVRDVVLVQ